jgi:ABC-type phosphate transport system ATPase subunit
MLPLCILVNESNMEPTNQIFKNPEKELIERYISGKFG